MNTTVSAVRPSPTARGWLAALAGQRPRRGLVLALALSLILHGALSLWPVEVPTTPDDVPLQATITEMPPPPVPAPVAAAKARPKPRRATAPPPPAPIVEPEPVAAPEPQALPIEPTPEAIAMGPEPAAEAESAPAADPAAATTAGE